MRKIENAIIKIFGAITDPFYIFIILLIESRILFDLFSRVQILERNQYRYYR